LHLPSDYSLASDFEQLEHGLLFGEKVLDVSRKHFTNLAVLRRQAMAISEMIILLSSLFQSVWTPFGFCSRSNRMIRMLNDRVPKDLSGTMFGILAFSTDRNHKRYF
jgi:hypothetical protein